MNRDIVKMIEGEARKRPELKLLIDKGVDLTESEIEAYKAPLPWFKKALKERKLRLAISTSVSFGRQVDPMGKVGYWGGEECWVKINDRSEILIKTGDAIWYSDSGELWIDTIKCKEFPDMFHRINFAITATKTQYRDIIQEVLRRRYDGTNVPSIGEPQPFTFTVTR